MTTQHSPTALLNSFLDCIENKIVPLTAAGVASGSKVFGAAILKKDDLSVVIAATNNEKECPLWHGEVSFTLGEAGAWIDLFAQVHTIKQFYEKPASERPSSKDCVFLTTHEPCSLCLRLVIHALNSP